MGGILHNESLSPNNVGKTILNHPPNHPFYVVRNQFPNGWCLLEFTHTLVALRMNFSRISTSIEEFGNSRDCPGNNTFFHCYGCCLRMSGRFSETANPPLTNIQKKHHDGQDAGGVIGMIPVQEPIHLTGSPRIH